MAFIILTVGDSENEDDDFRHYTLLLKERGYPDKFIDDESNWTLFFKKTGLDRVGFDSEDQKVTIFLTNDPLPLRRECDGYAESAEAVELLIKNFNRKYGNNKET